ncbi:family 10 glycosylhydrolase [Flindersiella endophytica]
MTGLAAVSWLTAGAAATAGATAGATAAQADEAVTCPPPDPAVPKRQLRSYWIASVTNIDWPSRTGLTAEQQQTEYLGWLDLAQERQLNSVIVQIRPTADAFWPSPYEPWSRWLSGTQGTDPGYDPLAFAVRETHKRNLEFHAWFNPYRVSMNDKLEELAPNHPARLHPEWIVLYGGRYYYNPGIPEVRDFVEDAIMDAVEKYDIDGVHFDDYFYPYPVAGQVFNDDATYAQYGGGFATKADWRRNNIDLLISELSQRIKAAKPWVKFGVSPFAVWRNKATDPEGSDTTAGVQTYDDLGADTRKWVREEWIDYIVPQVYWNIGFTAADYAKLIPWWSEQVAGTDVQLYIGQATYKVETSTQSPAWQDPSEMTKHLFFNRSYPQVSGDVYFSAIQVRANRLGHMDLLQADHYSRPALLPVMPQLGGWTPHAPAIVNARGESGGVRLTWADLQPASKRSTSYAIYRFDGKVRLDACDFTDATHLLTAVRGNGRALQAFTDSTAAAGKHYTYAVSALDRVANESRPSQAVTVKAK